jgi:ubiquinone/menaquinone biosynthesis C-methylase UbiE
MPYYAPSVEVTGIDLSPRMLDQARTRASNLNLDVNLREMDVQKLDFPDGSFDTVLASFVFCGVPDPVLGLTEMRRVCKSGGRMVLLEHVRPSGRLMAVDNIRNAGWTIEIEESFLFGIFRWVEAVK